MIRNLRNEASKCTSCSSARLWTRIGALERSSRPRSPSAPVHCAYDLAVSHVDRRHDDQLSFQDAGHNLRDELIRVRGVGYGDVWFDWSGDVGRLKVAVTSRCDPGTVSVARKVAEDFRIHDRVDFVTVVWSARELAAARERMEATLDPVPRTLSGTSTSPAQNVVVIAVTEEFGTADFDWLEAAIQAAGMSVQVVVQHGRWVAA